MHGVSRGKGFDVSGGTFLRLVSGLLLVGGLGLGCDESESKLCVLDHGEIVDTAPGLCIARNFSKLVEDPEALSAAMDDMERVGATSLRSDVLWHLTEPEPGVWDFERYDALVDALEGRDMELIALLAYGNPWASSQTTGDWTYPPDDPTDFAHFAAEVARRYMGRVSRYEIWNEPNAGRFWKPGLSGDPVAWAELVLEAEAAIHGVDPGATVILGGTFFPDQIIQGGIEFLEEAVGAYPELLTRADAVAIHPYTLYLPHSAPEFGGDGETPLVDIFAQTRAITGDMPVVVSEYGWPSWGLVDMETQGQFLERSALISASEGATDICWYTLWDFEEPDNPEHSFGLLDREGGLKPSGEAFSRLSDALSRASGAAKIHDLPAGSYGVHLEGVGDVVWGEGEVCGESMSSTPRWF
jgi:hypothetical protein